MFNQNSKVFPSFDTIAKRRGKHRNAIITHVNKLRELGLITTKRRGYSKTNEYFLSSTVFSTNDEYKSTNRYTAKGQKTGYQKNRNMSPKNTGVNNIEDNNLSPEEYKRIFDKGYAKLQKRHPNLFKKHRAKKRKLLKKMSI
jgi:hypothetical protein